MTRLLTKPSPKMNGVSLREALMVSALLRGNAYAFITARDRHEYPDAPGLRPAGERLAVGG